MTEAAKTILICDDDPDLRAMIARYLQRRGWTTLPAAGAGDMRRVLDRESVDLVILDLAMPDEDGLSALRRLRGESDIPVIMLTGIADTADRIVGLEMGADDYLAKPVDLRELEARIRALLRRRSSPVPPAPAADEAEFIPIGPHRLNLTAATLERDDGAELQLTAMEFRLLRELARHRGRVLSRERLLDETRLGGLDPFDRSIDLRISRLRRKIESDPAHPKIIQTVRGLGYVLR